jgi:hypothetical protein
VDKNRLLLILQYFGSGSVVLLIFRQHFPNIFSKMNVSKEDLTFKIFSKWYLEWYGMDNMSE